MISAKVVADSIGPSGVRLTTFSLTYPRFIHSEFMTHRMISRNASSSRAIPVKKQIQMVVDNPAIPLDFRKNKKGMQAGEPLEDQVSATTLWLIARNRAVEMAQKMADMDIHKQYANRILEPFAHISVVATATDWDNFFALRCHPAAQPEIHALANEMHAALSLSAPRLTPVGQWHIPFMDEQAMLEVKEKFSIRCLQDSEEALDLAVRRSVARCARVSYLNHDGTESSIEDDERLYTQLLGGTPIHASPAEHQAMAIKSNEYHGNLFGWLQYRKLLKNENVSKYNPGMFDGSR